MHDLVTAGAGGVLMMIALVRNLGYRTRAWRARQRDRWGRRHLAHVPTQWSVVVDRQLRSQRRLDVALTWWLLAMLYIFQTPSSRAWAAWLGVVPGVLVLARGLVIARTASALPSGARVARAREVAIGDYLSTRERVASWTTVGLAVFAIGVADVRTSSTVLLVPMALVLAAGALVEAVGVRFARMPEPAENANQLYVHAFRADALRGALAVTAMSALLLVLAMPRAVGMPSEQAIGFVEFVGIVAVCLGLVGFFPDRPVARMRARLWPALGPDQLVMPDDAVRSQEIAS